MILGVGTGESLNEVPATAMQWPEMKERFARLRESIVLIRKLWTEERVSFEGEYYRTENATIYDRPEAMVPIYIAAGGPMVAKYAGRAVPGHRAVERVRPLLQLEGEHLRSFLRDVGLDVLDARAFELEAD